jgi:hypothetical protein
VKEATPPPPRAGTAAETQAAAAVPSKPPPAARTAAVPPADGDSLPQVDADAPLVPHAPDDPGPTPSDPEEDSARRRFRLF